MTPAAGRGGVSPPNPPPKRRISKRERELRQELHFRQMIVRMDQRSLQRSMEACKRTAAQLRTIQKERRRNILQ